MGSEHALVIQELAAQFGPLFGESTDGVYLWLDDDHKICNDRLASLFGQTVQEWCSAPSFLDSSVADEDRHNFAWNYHHSVANLSHPVTFRFRALRKDGSTFAAETDMIPISHRGHAIAYHFVRQVGD
jgi:PAS domain-containing protein